MEKPGLGKESFGPKSSHDHCLIIFNISRGLAFAGSLKLQGEKRNEIRPRPKTFIYR